MAETQKNYVLALDVGTSSTRAILFDAHGTTVPNMTSQRTYQLTTSSEGEVSVDADMLAGVVAETISDVLKSAGNLSKQIVAVAIDTFWHSLLGVDASGHPVMPVITWEDGRPARAALALRQELDEQAVHDRTGVRFHSSYWPAKLRWLAQAQPDTFKRAAQWISFGEYLHRKFLGRSVCSLSMASATGMLHAQKLIWDNELTQFLGVKSSQLPQLGDLHDSLKGLTGEYASLWPTLKDVPWYPALGDGAAACVGSGCITPANWSLTMGTSSALRIVGVPTEVVPSLGLWRYLVDAKRPVIGGALSEGGNLVAWMDNTLKLPDLKNIEPLVAALEPDAHGLTILPFLSGERSIGWHGDARMTIAGISNHTSSAELMRAGMEAIAYRLLTVHKALKSLLKVDDTTHKVIASGGTLLKFTSMCNVVCDTLGTPIYPSLEQEASARGAALLALEALNIIPDLSQIAPTLDKPKTPNQQHTALYQKAAERQDKLYQLLLAD